tara:strand:- start:52768 stop:54102 length:1335 start_codon:yes stop_codon:yes gene_type:complete
MFVFNHCTNDSRVFKEAESLINAGYHVEVYALYKDGLQKKENRNGLIINRVELNPFHKRIFGRKKKQSNKNAVISTPLQNSEQTTQQTKNQKTAKPATPELHWYKNNFLYKGMYNAFKSVLLSVYRPLTYYDFYRKTSRALKQSKPFDVYHAHDMNTLYAAYKAAKKHNAKLVYDSHELYVDRNKLQKPSVFYKFLSYRFEGYFARKCDAVITVGEKIAELLQSRYRLKNKVYVVMNAPSKNIEEHHESRNNKLREALNIPENYKLLIYTGGITFNRGLENLVRSLKFLPNMYLVMMGYGKESFKNTLIKIANENNVADRFSYYGPVRPNEVTAYTQEADLGVAPIINACLSYYYCAPNKIFEYLLGGIPVVSSNFPEMEKIVKKNNIGTTFNPEKPESIAQAVKEIFSDEEKYKQMKANTKLAAEKYNWENEEQKLLDIYKNL